MRISIETAYPSDPDTVVGLRLDPGFLAEMARRTGAVDQHVEATAGEDGSGRSVVRRTTPTHEFPDVARRLVGDTIVIVEEVEWTARDGATRTAQGRLHAEGLPVSLTSTIVLRPAAQGSVESLTGEITARIPLVGGRIEKAVEPALRDGIQVQAATVRDWLTR